MRTLSIWAALAMVASVHATGVGTGSISGVVQLTGRAPEIAPRVPAFNTEVCGDEPRPVPSLVLGTNQAVANVIVYLGVSTGPAAPTNAAAILDHVHCELTPRIQILGSGAPLILRNSDPTLHVVQIDLLNASNPPTVLLKTALPFAGSQKQVLLERYHKPEMLRVSDGNDENGAVAYLAVLPFAWSALTDEQGRFVIKGIPPGNYRLFLWHEVLGTTMREIHVTGERATTAVIEFAAPALP